MGVDFSVCDSFDAMDQEHIWVKYLMDTKHINLVGFSTLAKPKSASLTSPLLEMRMLLGLMSLWIMFREWQKEMASRIMNAYAFPRHKMYAIIWRKILKVITMFVEECEN